MLSAHDTLHVLRLSGERDEGRSKALEAAALPDDGVERLQTGLQAGNELGMMALLSESTICSSGLLFEMSMYEALSLMLDLAMSTNVNFYLYLLFMFSEINTSCVYWKDGISTLPEGAADLLHVDSILDYCFAVEYHHCCDSAD
jgi:hypothetical protein